MTKKKKINKKKPLKDDYEFDDERYEIIDDGDGLPQRYELDPETYNETEGDEETEKEDFRITKDRDFDL